MKDQHTLIKGYRDLSLEEIDLINRIKIAEAQVLELTREVLFHVEKQIGFAESHDGKEARRIAEASPTRWRSIAVTNLEQGFMALVRAVAQPTPPRLEKDRA